MESARAPSTQSTVWRPTFSSFFFFFKICCGGQLDALLAEVHARSLLERRAGQLWQPFTTTFPRFQRSSWRTAVRPRRTCRVPNKISRVTSRTSSEASGVAMIGLCFRQYNWEMVWHAMLRFSSDLIAMRTDSLVGPGHNKHHRWALFWYLAEFEVRSKIRGCDEGEILKHPMWETIQVHFPGESACLSTSRPGTGGALENPRSTIERVEGGGCHAISNEARGSISRNRSRLHGPELQARLRRVSVVSAARYCNTCGCFVDFLCRNRV